MQVSLQVWPIQKEKVSLQAWPIQKGKGFSSGVVMPHTPFICKGWAILSVIPPTL